MAKRTSLAERLERDEKPRGVNAFFDKPAESAKAEKKERPKASKKAPVRRAAKTVEPAEIVGVYFHITDDQDSLLDRMKLLLKTRDKRKVDRSELVREAIDLLAKHYNIPKE